MNQILYERRCKCKEEVSITHRQKKTIRSEAKTAIYQSPFFANEEFPSLSKTFYIKYEKKLSIIAKFLLNSFHKKYLYYAMDDILYTLKSNESESNDLLAILYSTAISLQNNFSVNFFDIWIQEIYVNEVPKKNKFLTKDSEILESFCYITIKLFYKLPTPPKKRETLW